MTITTKEPKWRFVKKPEDFASVWEFWEYSFTEEFKNDHLLYEKAKLMLHWKREGHLNFLNLSEYDVKALLILTDEEYKKITSELYFM